MCPCTELRGTGVVEFRRYRSTPVRREWRAADKRSGDRSHLSSTPRPASAASISGSSSPSIPAPPPSLVHTGSISTNQSSTCHFSSPAADSTFPSLRNISNGENNNNNDINNYKWKMKEITPLPGPKWTGYSISDLHTNLENSSNEFC